MTDLPTHADPASRNSYDEVPYPSIPKAETHPARLATLATLFGMRPKPVKHCRVLELACADGGNLMPMAQALPESEFVGIDFSARQIAEGQAVVEALGLKNIRLQHLNLLDVAPDLGQFDYIIAYGVYSWVSRPVRDKILEICRTHLAPDGVAFVSYNTYPGWHMRGMLRDMALYHARRLDDLRTAARQTRSLLSFLVESVQATHGRFSSALDLEAYSITLKREQELLEARSDSYLVHEFLEDANDPVYFCQFVEHAQQHGLQYLAESDFFTMDLNNFPPQVAESLQQLGQDVIEIEQYMDFVRLREFRQTLLCHSHIRLNRDLKPEVLQAFYVASPAVPVSANPDLHSNAPEKFRGPSGTVLSTGNPIAKAAMVHLGEIWPQAVPLDRLLAEARTRLDPEALPVQGAARLARDRQSLSEMLLRCYSLDMVELHVHAPDFVVNISECPVASPMARYQAQQGTTVTNLRHEQITLDDEVSYHLLRHLDGTHNRAALLEALEGLVAEGVLVVQPNGAGSGPVRNVLAQALDRNIRRLSRAALLVG